MKLQNETGDESLKNTQMTVLKPLLRFSPTLFYYRRNTQ